MKLAHEALPNGVPSSYNWSQNPRVGMGVNPRDGFTASTAWGQVYVEKGTTPVANTRVQLRNMQMYYFSISNQCWVELQNSVSVKGGAYRENFQGNANRPADQRNESNNGGGLSVRAGDGYNYHFWPTDQRATIDDPDDIGAIFSTCQARLILHDPNGEDDRSTARYLLSVGGDYWYNESIGWAEFKTNGDWAIGRFRYVTTSWQSFNGWAGDVNIIINNPPPKE